VATTKECLGGMTPYPTDPKGFELGLASVLPIPFCPCAGGVSRTPILSKIAESSIGRAMVAWECCAMFYDWFYAPRNVLTTQGIIA
jgi:hypothetical protein